jgi:hypothetical protein
MHFPKILDAPDMKLFLNELKLVGGYEVDDSYYSDSTKPEAWVITSHDQKTQIIYTWASLGYWVRNQDGVGEWPDALTHAEEYAEEHEACSGR